MSEVIWYNDILYTDIGNNKLMIGTGANTGFTPNAVKNINTVPENLILPSSVCFKTVTIIGRESFTHCTRIKSIFIPATIERVDSYAFEYLSNLVNITVALNSKLIFKASTFLYSNSNFVIYFGGTKCQTEDIIGPRSEGSKYTVIVSPAYKCKTFGNLKKNDIFTVDYSFKWFGNKPRTYPIQRTSSLYIHIYLLIVHSNNV